jgi:hypothetical protein
MRTVVPLVAVCLAVVCSNVVLAGAPQRLADQPTSTTLSVTPLAGGARTQAQILGGRPAAAGDINGDGLSDFVVARPSSRGGLGAVDVYIGQPGGGYMLFQTLTGNLGEQQFGYAVAPAGDVDGDGYDDILVSSPFYNGTYGDVYLFRGGPVSMSLDTILVGSPEHSSFGAAIAGAGDVDGDGYDDFVVGAPLGSGSDYGTSFLYRGGLGGLTQPPQVMHGTVSGGKAGTTVAGVGDMDADGYDDVMVGSIHSVYFYRGGPSGLSTTPSDSLIGAGSPNTPFASAVAPAGDFDGDGYADAVIGASSATDGSGASGAAYLVHGASTGINHTLTTLGTGLQASSNFGAWVGSGDFNGDGLGDVVVGQPNYHGGQGSNQGRAFVYYGNLGSGFANATVTMESPGGNGTRFGLGVSGLGDVGADGFCEFAVGSASASDTVGTTYFFPGQVAVPAKFVSISYGPNTNGGPIDMYGGQSVSTSGDFNGDGYDDCVWGVPRITDTATAEGGVYCMSGGSGSEFLDFVCLLHSNLTGSLFGQSCAIAGDVNGDGYDDVVVGAPGSTSPLASQGAAFLYLGSSSGPDTNAAQTWLGSLANLKWGSAVAGVGDLNHDGYADIAIASTEDATNGAHAGRVSIYLGGPGGPSTTSAFDLFGAAAGDSLGFSVAPAGDVNGDGYDDMIVGAPGAASGSGKFYIVYGGPSPPFTTAAFTDFSVAGSHIGWSVAGRGDLDGDGYADVAVGAPGYPASGGQDGACLVHLGGPGGLSATYAQLNAPVAGGQFGASLSWGDMNADGYSDLAIGAPGEMTGVTNTGSLYVYLANGAGSFSLPGTKLTKASTNYGRRGTSIAANGDINGDGFADIIDGAPYSFTLEGVIEQIAGGGALLVRERLERQRRADESAPISLGGATDATGDFHLDVRARTAAGRKKVQLQTQEGPVATPWASIPTVSSAASLTGAPNAGGSYLDETAGFANQPAGSNIKWRLRVHAHSPYFPYTPWLTPSGNASTLTDLFVPGSAVAVGRTPGGTIGLAPIEPNPSRGEMTFSFRLTEPGAVQLDIYDVAGRLVRTVDHRVHPAGASAVTWDGANAQGRKATAGIYFARLRAGQVTMTRQFVRL